MATRIVVVGNMHGGAWIAARLKRRLRKGTSVTFVHSGPDLHAIPILCHIIGNGAHVPVRSARKELEHLDINVAIGDIQRHDTDKKRILLDHGFVDYDVLLVDPEVQPDFSGVPGASKHAKVVLMRSDAHAVCRQLDSAMAHAEHKKSEMNVCVSSSSPMGLSLALAVKTRLGEHANITVVETGLPPRTGSHRGLRKRLDALGITLSHAELTGVDNNHVMLGEEKVPCDMLLWAGPWKPVQDSIESGSGVLRMDAEEPFFPAAGIHRAREAANWVSSFLGGKPKPAAGRIKPTVLPFDDHAFTLGSRLGTGKSAWFRWKSRIYRYLDL